MLEKHGELLSGGSQKPLSSGLEHCLDSCIMPSAVSRAPGTGSAHLQTSLCGLPCSHEAGEWHLPPGTKVKSEVRRSGGVGSGLF